MGHTFSNLLAHVIFSTKNRQPLITDAIGERLYAYMAGVARKEFGWAKRIGGASDHIHGLIELRTDISMGHAMNRWKSLSSGWVHKTFPELRRAWGLRRQVRGERLGTCLVRLSTQNLRL